jgi:hypothetical protein
METSSLKSNKVFINDIEESNHGCNVETKNEKAVFMFTREMLVSSDSSIVHSV